MSKLKILVIATSLRKESLSKKLARIASKELKSLGHEITFVDLADFPLPVYNQDVLSSDFPREAVQIEQMMRAHNVWMIATPEHNYSISSSTKNLIDWVSRSPENSPNVQFFGNKVIGLMSTSPGSAGGERSVRHLREILSYLGCIVLPSHVCIGSSSSAFNDKDELVVEYHQKSLHKMLNQLSDFGLRHS